MSASHQLDPAHHSPARQHPHNANSDEQRYQARYRDLKKKVKEVESENEKLLMQVMQTKHSIQRLRLERSILYEKLGGDQHAPPPPPPPPHRHHSQSTSRAPPHVHHHHHHTSQPHAAPGPYPAAVPPYPASASSSSTRHHHSSRPHAHNHPPQYAQQQQPQSQPPYAPAPAGPPRPHPLDTHTRSGSAAPSSAHARSPVHPADERHYSAAEPGAREYYDEPRHGPPPADDWRRRGSVDARASPARDSLPSVAAVLGDRGDRKRKRSESRDPERELSAPMHLDDS